MIKIVEKTNLGLDNRDGYLWAAQDSGGFRYLILEADTLHNKEVFEGMGSTEHIRISKKAYRELI